MSDALILPYRTGPSELVRWVEVRARGRGEGTGRGAKGLEGTATTAIALSLAAPDGTLTDSGRRLALADDAERRRILRRALAEYPPYGNLLAEIERRGERESTADWVETWWATHEMGNSGSNRREGAATLGRLAEWAGLGRYIPGRRGRPTRIEWMLRAAPAERPAPTPAPPPTAAAAPAPQASEPPPSQPSASEEMNRLTIDLANGSAARLELPLRLSSAEKRRLLQLLDLLIREE
jgi:hypothetical protein